MPIFHLPGKENKFKGSVSKIQDNELEKKWNCFIPSEENIRKHEEDINEKPDTGSQQEKAGKNGRSSGSSGMEQGKKTGVHQNEKEKYKGEGMKVVFPDDRGK